VGQSETMDLLKTPEKLVRPVGFELATFGSGSPTTSTGQRGTPADGFVVMGKITTAMFPMNVGPG
jgi:hypothetical protein